MAIERKIEVKLLFNKGWHPLDRMVNQLALIFRF